MFTPHARGSTEKKRQKKRRGFVYPACAGIDRKKETKKEKRLCLPRMRGDRPYRNSRTKITKKFTPHARGSTVSKEDPGSGSHVYPACAGIDPQPGQSPHHGSSLPRMRGDRPWSALEIFWSPRFTPHARGSTPTSHAVKRESGVYPACAGIDLTWQLVVKVDLSLPRMRGDRPMSFTSVSLKPSFTPHARGSTYVVYISLTQAFVYPACAGIDPSSSRVSGKGICLPRMRGDRPRQLLNVPRLLEFTPHARGSTLEEYSSSSPPCVYPACAGIDPLHHRAGYR